MPQKISVDEFLSERKDFVKSGDVLMKVSKGVSSWNPEKRSARFCMSAEIEDRYKDIVIQSGIDLTQFEKNPAAPLSHNSRSFPVGSWSNVTKILTGRPKRLEGDLTLLAEGDDPDADRLARHIAAGTMRACSIGFIPNDIERREVPEDKRDTYYYPGYLIHTCELLECSPCLIGANPAAIAKAIEDGADADDLRMYRDLVEDALDNWARHPETGLLVPREEMEKAYRLTVEKIKGDVITPDPVANDVTPVEVAKAIDETEGLPEETKQTLIQRGMVFTTELKSEEKTFAGYVIAKSHDDAEAIVTERGSGETVLGELTEQRDVEFSTKEDVVEHEKAVSEIHIGLHVDGNLEETKKHLEDLEATADRVEKRFEGIFARISKFFGGSEKAVERVEPEITIEPEVKSPPTDDELARAKAKQAAIRAKLISKELIAAE